MSVCDVCDTPPILPFLNASRGTTPQSQPLQNIQVRASQLSSTQGQLGRTLGVRKHLFYTVSVPEVKCFVCILKKCQLRKLDVMQMTFSLISGEYWQLSKGIKDSVRKRDT